MSEKDKKGVVTNQQVLQVAENASKGVSDLSKVIAEVQKAADQNASKASSMLASIQANAEKIKEVEEGAKKTANEMQENKLMIDQCVQRIGLLETKTRLAKEIDDQELKIRTLQKRISVQDTKKAANFVTLHGIPLPKADLPNAELSTIIAENISKALGKDLANYIFSSKDQAFINIASWFNLPGGGGHPYNRATPEIAKNSVIFIATTRVQAVNLESKIRGALIATHTLRKSNDFAGLEIGFYTDSPKVKALYKLLLYKGKLITGAVTQVSNYRVSWKGGARKNDPSAPCLTLELKADKEYISRREDYFFQNGNLVRSVWTEDYNILLSDLSNIWFPRKPDQVQNAENRIKQIAVNNPDTNEASPIQTTAIIENSNKRNRESPGIQGNRAKGSHLDLEGIDEVEEILSENEEPMVEMIRKEVDESKDATNMTEAEIEQKNAGDFIHVKPKRGGFRNNWNTGAPKKGQFGQFPALTPLKPNAQQKISSVFSTTKKPVIDSGLPIPIIQ